ncbi:SULT2A1 [Branchiostoma lanceolatum]|uniref:Sulfotransferase n=1 Tax=Branchiostoma lanceolatum TaxID=7740 RepID=A0A8K0A247_BRALA|nr:SULT2A1 [Branchiostoma lanceolatum]
MSGRHSMLWTHEGVSLSRVITKETLDAVLDFQIRDDDIVVASFPKTGTNWLAEIAVKILRAAGKTDKSVDSMEFGPMEMKRPTATQPGYITLADMPSPRLVMTHLPVKFAPQGISKPQNKDLLSAVKTIVAFLEVDLDEATVKDIAEASTFDNMKAGLDNSTIAERRGIARKGIIGDWKNTFSSEESAAFDAWCEKKLGGTGLTFDFE